MADLPDVLRWLLSPGADAVSESDRTWLVEQAKAVAAAGIELANVQKEIMDFVPIVGPRTTRPK